MTASTKTRRINLRATERQEAILRQAAEQSQTSLTEFVLSSAVERAERLLADRRTFVATDEQYAEFVRLLDEPVSTERLAELFSRPDVFDVPFELAE